MIDIPLPPQALYVFSRMTFGNVLVLNGLIRVLARKHAQVKWVVNTKYISPARQTISDVPNVQVLAARDDQDVRSRWIPQCANKVCLGPFAPGNDDRDSEAYRLAGVPYEARWTECRFPTKLLSGCREPKKRIALVYETTEHPVKQEFLPSDLDIFRVIHRASALDWLPEMFSATELHFIDSSFLKLAECLHAMGALTNTTLVYHRYAKGSTVIDLRAPWKVFD